jgi:hypothetical protein
VICNLRRQWHSGIASAVLGTSRNRNSRPDWTLATNHDDKGISRHYWQNGSMRAEKQWNRQAA